PLLRVAGARGNPRDRRRPRQGRARPGDGDREERVEVRDPRARGLVGRDRRRPRVRRIERRKALRARRADGPEAVGVRRRRAADVLARPRVRPRGDRIAGRTAVLLRVRRADGITLRHKITKNTKLTKYVLEKSLLVVFVRAVGRMPVTSTASCY